jgi:outer membrane protein TolC
MNNYLIIIMIFLAFNSGLFATPSEDGTLSLTEALKKADEQNFDIRLSESEVEISRADHNKTYSLFLPQFTLSETFVTTNDPLNVFGLKLKQEIVAASDFNPGLLNDPKRIKNYTTKIEVQQPLINLDGLLGRSAASAGLKAAEEKRNRTIEYIHFEVKRNYFQLVLANASLKVIGQSLEAVKSFRDQAKHYFEQGLIHRSDLLMAEVQVLDIESKKLEAENMLKDASERLQFLMGVQGAAEIIPTDTLTISVTAENFHDKITSLDNRSDMKAMRYGISATEKIHAMNLWKLAPTLNAFGSYEMNENKIFGTQGKNWMAGIMLKWEIFKGWDHFGGIQKSAAQLRHIKTDYDKTRQKSMTEIESSARNLTVMRKKTELTKEAVQQAGESLRIISDRYAKGLEKTSDLLMAETTYSKARLNYLQTLYGYNVNLFMLELLYGHKGF